MTEVTRSAASSPLLTGVVMLIVGFWLGLEGFSDSAIYNTSVSLLVLGMKIGGFVMLAVAALYWTGVRMAWLIDTICLLVIGVLMIAVAVVWLIHTDWVYGIVLMILGVMTTNSARRNWVCSAASVTLPPSEAKNEVPTAKDETPIADKTPAVGIHEVQQPASEESPPEGFLAELGRADNESG